MEATANQQREFGKESLVKKVLFGGGALANSMKISYVLGLFLGATGRATGVEWVPATPLIMDAFHGVAPNAERAICYAAYGTGVATAYADKVYSVIADTMNQI